MEMVIAMEFSFSAIVLCYVTSNGKVHFNKL